MFFFFFLIYFNFYFFLNTLFEHVPVRPGKTYDELKTTEEINTITEQKRCIELAGVTNQLSDIVSSTKGTYHGNVMQLYIK